MSLNPKSDEATPFKPTTPEEEVLVGYKGANAYDPGVIYAAYLPLISSSALRIFQVFKVRHDFRSGRGVYVKSDGSLLSELDKIRANFIYVELSSNQFRVLKAVYDQDNVISMHGRTMDHAAFLKIAEENGMEVVRQPRMTVSRVDDS